MRLSDEAFGKSSTNSTRPSAIPPHCGCTSEIPEILGAASDRIASRMPAAETAQNEGLWRNARAESLEREASSNDRGIDTERPFLDLSRVRPTPATDQRSRGSARASDSFKCRDIPSTGRGTMSARGVRQYCEIDSCTVHSDRYTFVYTQMCIHDI